MLREAVTGSRSEKAVHEHVIGLSLLTVYGR
jgi:hypothetical protein